MEKARPGAHRYYEPVHQLWERRRLESDISLTPLYRELPGKPFRNALVLKFTWLLPARMRLILLCRKLCWAQAHGYHRCLAPRDEEEMSKVEGLAPRGRAPETTAPGVGRFADPRKMSSPTVGRPTGVGLPAGCVLIDGLGPWRHTVPDHNHGNHFYDQTKGVCPMAGNTNAFPLPTRAEALCS